jgi:probable F420-dependent oxidoreductase
MRRTGSGALDESEHVMRFGIIPPVRTGVTADPEWMASFARHAEACGFESVVLVEHAVVISDYTSTYPYASSGRMPLPDDCRIPDPLDLMAFLAAVTDRITLGTGVLVVPNHQPVVLAKRIATVDVLSAGRVRMCVGVGWMDEELRATGADPRRRGRRTDETIEAMRVLWADAGPAGADFEGEFVSFHHAHSFPKPVRPGGVPLHIGGHSEAAARRAGRLGDGFQPLGLDAELLAVRMDQVRRAADDAGRDGDAIELSLSGYLPTTNDDEIDAAERAGATRIVASTSMNADLSLIHDEMSAFAERFGLSAEGSPGATVGTDDPR